MVSAVKGGHNIGHPGGGWFPGTVERVGGTQPDLIGCSSELARKETGIRRGGPRREDSCMGTRPGGSGGDATEIHRVESTGGIEEL